MANEHRGRGGGGADRRGHQTTRAKEQPIDLDTITPEELNRRSEEWGRRLADRRRGIKTNQIRNIYGTIQHIRVRASQPNSNTADINRSLIFLKPKLAYASGRQSQQSEMRPLRDFLVDAINSVVKSQKPEKARENFFILMESIVAYHKFHGGQDS